MADGWSSKDLPAQLLVAPRKISLATRQDFHRPGRDELTGFPVYPSDPSLSPRWKIHRPSLSTFSSEGEGFQMGTVLKLGGTGTGRRAGGVFLHPSWGDRCRWVGN